MMIIGIVAALIVAGLIIWFKEFRGKASPIKLNLNKKKAGEKLTNEEKPPEPNTWVLRPDSVGFEYVASPAGMQYTFENDGKDYYKMIEIGGKLQAFVLPDIDPDKMYYDPKEYANLLQMECNRKAFSWKDDLFQKISIGIMAAIIVGILISFALV